MMVRADPPVHTRVPTIVEIFNTVQIPWPLLATMAAAVVAAIVLAAHCILQLATLRSRITFLESAWVNRDRPADETSDVVEM